MDLMTFLVTIGAIVLVVLQGLACLTTGNRAVALGILDLAIAGIATFVVLAISLGQLVIATDLGVLLVQGSWARRSLAIVLVMSAVLPVLCVYRVACLNKWTSRPWKLGLWLAAAGSIAIGLWAAWQISPVTAQAGELRVYVYNVWWPPLILWLGICFAFSTLALIGSDMKAAYLVFAAVPLTPLAMFVRHWPTLADGAGELWRVLEYGGYFVMTLAVIVFLKAEPEPWLQTRRASWTTFAICIALGVLFPFFPLGLRWALALTPLLVMTAAIAVTFVLDIHQLPFMQSFRDRTMNRAKVGPLLAILLSLSVLVIVLCLIDLFAVGLLPRALTVFLIFGSWLMLAERLAFEDALEQVPRKVKDVVFPWVEDVAKGVWSGIVTLAKACVGGLNAVSGGGWAGAVKSALALIAGLLILTAAAEVATYRQIVVSPFQWTGAADAKEDATRAAAISNLIVNAIGRLRRDLRPDLVNATRGLSGEHPANMTLLAAGGESTSLESAVAKSDDLKLGGVNVPISFFVQPVQAIVRRLLGVRVVEGSIWGESNSDKVVLVNISDGTSWRETATSVSPPDAAGARCDGESHTDVDKTTALVEKLAFNIASTDASFLAAGLTTNYEAFVPFRYGLTRWDAFENLGRTADLTAAVDCFREAVRLDRRFAAAYFRLGVALRTKRELRSAIEAFRESATDNRGYVRAALQEAATRFDYASGNWSGTPLSEDGRQHERLGARTIWQQIVALPMRTVSFSERRAALLGICQHELDETMARTSAERPTETYSSYFYCSRGASLWSWIPARSRDAQERRVQADFLNILAIALEQHHGETRQDPTDGSEKPWSCADWHIEYGGIDNRGAVQRFGYHGSKRSPIAIGYYRESLTYAPDDLVIRCNLASALVYQSRDRTQMQLLSKIPAMRVLLAWGLQQRGDNEVAPAQPGGGQPALDRRRWYHRAVAELDAALDMDPMSVEALLRYAGALHLSIRNDERRLPTAEEWFMWTGAERRLREARRLCAAWRMPDDLGDRAAGSLGQILLAQGRAQEAILELEPLVKRPWMFRGQAREDLAQAKLCASQQTADKKEAQRLRADAIDLFAQIVDEERRSDAGARMLTDESLDPDARQRSCVPAPDTPPGTPPTYEAGTPTYDQGLSCDRSEVTAIIGAAAPPPRDLMLRVWGGGVNTTIAIDGSGRVVRLEMPRQDRTRYYFARLEDAAGKVLSTPISVLTYKKGADCARSRITLAFRPRAATRVPAVQKASVSGSLQ